MAMNPAAFCPECGVYSTEERPGKFKVQSIVHKPGCSELPPFRSAQPTMDGLTEPFSVTCECTHDLSQHTQGYWAPCNADSCECKDFTINETGDK